MEKEEILDWSKKYDEDHPWWTQKEKELGDELRRSKELTKDDLVQVVEWKFKELQGRKKRILGLIAKNDDTEIRRISRHVLGLSSKIDSYMVNSFCTLHGVGPAVASTILTFYNPKQYGVFDIHIWRELFGKEPENLFTTKNYLKLLAKLRRIANEYSLDVRIVEKAFFKKNLDETKHSY
jgi:hypothetical protein